MQPPKRSIGHHEQNGYLYDLLQNGEHPSGLWRRCKLSNYLSGNPEWVALLNIDQLGLSLSSKTGQWGAKLDSFYFSPSGSRVLVALSQDGGATVMLSEFSLKDKSFIDGGFCLTIPVNTRFCWAEEDALLVATAPNLSTSSNAQPTVLRLERGQKLQEATTVFKGGGRHMRATPFRSSSPPGGAFLCIFLEEESNNEQMYIFSDWGELQKLNIPTFVFLQDFWKEQGLFYTSKEWRHGRRIYPAGSLVLYHMKKERTRLLWEADDENTVLSEVQRVKNGFLLTVTTNAAKKIIYLHADGKKWRRRTYLLEPGSGELFISHTSHTRNTFMMLLGNDLYWAHAQSKGIQTTPLL